MENSCSKEGFTLVELSIVLVIIGLLVGGILVGQSLIDSAKLSSEIRQYQQLSMAYQLFKDKFKKYPGDNDFFADAGDDDGIMENDKTLNSSGGVGITEERANFWKHISDAGILSQSYTNTEIVSVATVQPGVNLPAGHMSDIVGYSTWIDSNTKILYLFSYDNSLTDLAFTPAEALSIDVKLDDGRAEYLGGYNVAPIFANADCAIGTEYNISNDGKDCAIVVRFSIVDSVEGIVN